MLVHMISMQALATIVEHLDRFLRHKEIVDYPQAVNGLQLENQGRITRVCAAVDASERTIAAAVAAGADLLLVHHGLMWESHCPAWTGARYRKLRMAVSHDLAIYSSHLPLDLHPEVGNNILLWRALNFPEPIPFFESKGARIGLKADIHLPIKEVHKRFETAVGSRVLHAPGRSDMVRCVGVVTGGAGAEVAKAAGEGVDAFLTGEGPHWSYLAAEELGVHLLYGGHYATETFGVKALAAHLESTFGLPWFFVDHPTGL